MPCAPTSSLRFGELPTCKPLRAWLAELDDVPSWSSIPCTAGTSRRRIAGAIVRAPAGPLAEAVAGELDGAVADPGWAESWLEADAGARDAIESGLDELEAPTEPGLQPALGRLYEDGDLVYTGVEHADPRPGGLPVGR